MTTPQQPVSDTHAAEVPDNGASVQLLTKAKLISLLPVGLSLHLFEVPDALFLQDEQTLATLVKPTRQQRQLKLQFWEEYEAATVQNRRMDIQALCFGICTIEYLFQCARNKNLFAWLCVPSVKYETKVLEALDYGIERLRQVFDLPIYKVIRNKEGEEIGQELNAQVVSLQLRALQMLDMRKHGDYTKRIESKNLSLTKSLDPTSETSLEELDKKIQELESRSLVPAIDFTPKTMEIPRYNHGSTSRGAKGSNT